THALGKNADRHDLSSSFGPVKPGQQSELADRESCRLHHAVIDLRHAARYSAQPQATALCHLPNVQVLHACSANEIALSVRPLISCVCIYLSGCQCLPHATHAVSLLRVASGDAIAASLSSIELAPSRMILYPTPNEAGPRRGLSNWQWSVRAGNGMT